MKIGELAKLTRTPVETIRFYEKSALMPAPTRTDNNYRNYHQMHIDRLRFIRNCRALDLSHEEIRALLELVEQSQINNCEEAERILSEHLFHVQSRINELKQLEKKLFDLQDKCHNTAKNQPCGILQTLSKAEIEENSHPIPHTHGKHDFSHS